MKSLGMLILMTLLCVGIFMLSMGIRPTPASAAEIRCFQPQNCVTPADAHGWFGLNLNFGLPIYAPPVYAYPPPPPVWFYPPSAPVRVVPTPWPPQPDPATRYVQRALNILMAAGLNEDGIAGPATWSAISEFQRRNGLAVDGIAGTGTMAVIEHQMRAYAPPPAPPPPAPPAAKETPPPRQG